MHRSPAVAETDMQVARARRASNTMHVILDAIERVVCMRAAGTLKAFRYTTYLQQ
jgi:hypothetical protein